MWELEGPDCAAVVALSRDRILGTPTSEQDSRSTVPCGRALTARPSVATLIWLNEWCSGYGPRATHASQLICRLTGDVKYYFICRVSAFEKAQMVTFAGGPMGFQTGLYYSRRLTSRLMSNSKWQ